MIKLKLKKTHKYDNDIINLASVNYSLFLEKLNKLNNKQLIIDTYNYPYINKNIFAISGTKYEKIKTDTGNRIIKKVNYDRKDIFNILKYKPFNSNFFSILEILHKYDLINNTTENILEISGNPIFYEAIYYYEKKYRNNISNYNLLFLNNYWSNTKEKRKTYLQYYSQYMKLKTKEYEKNIDDKFIKNNIKKYDNIFSNITSKLSNDIKIIFDIFLYSILRLNKNGNLTIITKSVITKPMADLLLIGKMIFEDVYLYMPKISIKSSEYGIIIIFKKFIKLESKIQDELLTIFDKLKLQSQKIVSFLNLDISDKKYDFIREFNEDRYYCSYQYVNKMIKVEQMTEKEKNKYMKHFEKVQYINSILWAKEFDMDIISYYKKGFKDDFGKIIIRDIYSYHKPIIFSFKKSKIGSNLVEISDTIFEIANKFNITTYMIDTRNSEKYDKIKNIIRFYKPKKKPWLQLGSYIEKRIGSNITNAHKTKKKITMYSQAWIKMYEILTYFDLFDENLKTLKTFHLCELPGGFIRAINHYAFTRTNVKNFEWNAQSLHPEKADIKNNYGMADKYPDMWHWGKDNTGNITNPDNIKSYKKYCKDIQFITSDCGLGWKPDDKTLIKVDFAYIVAILYLLPKGGNFVAKFVLPLRDRILISAVYILYLHFEELIFYKTVQNQFSGEFYIIGKNYTGIKDDMMNFLFETLDNYDENVELNKKYTEEFMVQLENALGKLTDNFTFGIDRQLYYVDNFENIEECYINKIDDYIMEKNKDWFKYFRPLKLSNKHII